MDLTKWSLVSRKSENSGKQCLYLRHSVCGQDVYLVYLDRLVKYPLPLTTMAGNIESLHKCPGQKAA